MSAERRPVASIRQQKSRKQTESETTMGRLRNIRGSTLLRAALSVTLLSAAACSMVRMAIGTGAVPPAAEQFGLGPRSSSNGAYVAQLQPASPLKVRKMTSVNVRLTDARGAAVEGATITVDGGMPQHGHGLPTSPRVTKSHGDGVYQIDGVRFNMGGWWEFRLAIASPAGADTITFNLDL
jgi:hypothetical protein